MPVPTQFSDLSATIASNSPAGSDNVFPDLDNYLRAHAGLIKQLYDDTKVSELASATAPVSPGDVVRVLQSGVAKQASIDQLGFLQAGTGAATRTIQSKLRETVNVRDFGAVLNGTTDDLAAFNAAIQSVASGQLIEIVVDGPAYLSAGTSNSGRYASFIFKNGGGICTTPGGALGGETSRLSWPTRFTRQIPNGYRYDYSVNPPTVLSASNAIRHQYLNISGNSTILGSTNAYGVRKDYKSFAYGSGYDIAEGIIGIWDRSSGNDLGQVLTQWVVAVTPTVGGATTRWGAFASEMNISNRQGDSGWSAKRSSLNNWCGILQLVAENDDFGGGTATYDVLFHIMTGAQSTVKSTDGKPARAWNSWLMEPNAVVGGGYGMYHSGNDTGVAADNPKAWAGLAETWQTGLDMSGATFSDNQKAIILKSQDKIVFGTGSFPSSISGNSTAATVSLSIDNSEALRLTRGGSSAVNYINIRNASTGGGVYVEAAGSDADIVFGIRSKGADPIYLQPNSLTTVRVESVASQVNYLYVYGGATGNGPTLRAAGTDTNITASIQGTGTGGVRLKDGSGNNKVEVNSTGVGFHASTPIAKPTITGSRGGNAALASLLTQLASYGLITDSTTA